MSSMDASSITIDKFSEMFSAGKRFDGRGLFDIRDLDISYDVSNCAEGSARVKLGKSEVIVGVKLSLDKPYPDSPDKGNLMVSGDLLPLASPRYEAGPPKFDAIELPRLVDRAIRESHVIQLDKLVVTPGEKVWTVIIDVYPINDDGNMVDIATLGAIAALKKAVIPGIDASGNVDYKHRTKTKLPLEKDVIPISFTFYKLDYSIILDPTREEAETCEVKMTFALSKFSGKHVINSSQKSGARPFSESEINKIMELLPKKYDELNEKLKKFL